MPVWSTVDGPGSANPDAVGDSYLGHAPATVGRAFDPVTGSVVTAGPAMFGAAGTDGGAGWGTAAGVAGIGALAAGAAYLSRSGGIGLTSPLALAASAGLESDLVGSTASPQAEQAGTRE